MLKLKCPKHPQYAGKQAPRCSCEPCQALYKMRFTAYAERLTIVEPKPKKEIEREQV